MTREEDEECLKFRSVHPHEPLPCSPNDHESDNFGYVHLQGALEPKKSKTKRKKHAEGDEPSTNTVDDEEESYYWTNREELEAVLKQSLCNEEDYESSLGLPYPAISLQVLDNVPPFMKVRLKYQNPKMAQYITKLWREELKISPSQLFAKYLDGANEESQQQAPKFGNHPCQITQITTVPLPSENSWTRSNPPKFRRLLHENTDDEERNTTRFLFVTGLIEPEDPDSTASKFWNNPIAVMEAIRTVFNKFDTSQTGVEIFLPRNKSQPLPLTCHIGMRSATDVQRAIKELQGQRLMWEFEGQQISSGTLFLDYASVTQKAMKKEKFKQQQKNVDGEYEKYRGEPSRPECTSTTDHIEIPGLVIIEDFVSESEEDVLMATLTGPHAPWAPDQTNMSQTGAVKRMVQHYGYVFDYQTADVLRDRKSSSNNDSSRADCPPMPAMEDKTSSTEQGSPVVGNYVQNGLGWDVLAAIVDRTRKYAFSITTTTNATKEYSSEVKSVSSSETSYPNLNQLTVNHYKPGEGIGSHVDTISAFGDGLISLSLNSGIVMEFRKVVSNEETATSSNDDGDNNNENSSTTIKKLVYLPPRSLVLMSGDARYKWEHMIVTRRTDTVNGVVIPRKLRVSMTLRTALASDGTTPLDLVESRNFPPTWGGDDDGDDNAKRKSNALITPSAERDHVHAVYDAIATQWHHTRGRRGVLWPGARQFLQRLPPGSIVADVGCGDGKYFPAILEAGSYVIGTDISMPLLQTAFGSKNNNRGGIADTLVVSTPHRESLRDRPAVAVADCMSVPIRSDSCDAAICIAVMHHLSTLERRVRCIEELIRVVRDGGTINIQAWALDQAENSKRRFASTDVFVPFNAQPKYLDKNAIFQNEDSTKRRQVPPSFSSKNLSSTNGSKSIAEMYSEKYSKADYDEKKGLVVFQRYCHMYRKGELEEIAEQVQGATLLESGYETGNYFVILKVQKDKP